MATTKFGDKEYYNLGNEFYARFDKLNGHQVAIVVLRTDLELLVDRVNREKPGDIPNKDQFITAVAVSKAVAKWNDKESEYMGIGTLEGRPVYLYKTRDVFIGAMFSNDRTFVMLLPYPDPSVQQSEKAPTAPQSPPPASDKKCYENGRKVPCAQAVAPVSASGYQAEIINTRLVNWTNPEGRRMQMLLIDWRNTGSEPIGQVKATMTFFDASGRQIEEVKSYNIFVTYDPKNTIKPGQSYKEPNGQGFVVLSGAASAKAVLTKVAGIPAM